MLSKPTSSCMYMQSAAAAVQPEDRSHTKPDYADAHVQDSDKAAWHHIHILDFKHLTTSQLELRACLSGTDL